MNEEETLLYAEITLTAIRCRGSFINDMCHLEKLIDETISRHFSATNEKRGELLEVVLGNEKITFYNKIITLKILFEKHKPDIFINNTKMFKEILDLIELRNVLAHYMLDTTAEAFVKYKEGKIGFVKFKHNTETIWYSPQDLINRIAEIDVHVLAFRNFLSTWNVLPFDSEKNH